MKPSHVVVALALLLGVFVALSDAHTHSSLGLTHLKKMRRLLTARTRRSSLSRELDDDDDDDDDDKKEKKDEKKKKKEEKKKEKDEKKKASTRTPTKFPTKNPTNAPSKFPTKEPTSFPTYRTATPTKKPTQKCLPEFAKCGGSDHTGPTCCKVGLFCNKQNAHYSQCVAKAPVGNCKSNHQQCGGKNYKGAKCCQEGLECKRISAFYSKCAWANSAKTPTKRPTKVPTRIPTKIPTKVPTIEPTTMNPTTQNPTGTPTKVSTKKPTPKNKRRTRRPTPAPTYEPIPIVCEGESRRMFSFGGTVQECSTEMCDGKQCEYRQTHNGFHISSCPFAAGTSPKASSSIETAIGGTSDGCTNTVAPLTLSRLRQLSTETNGATLLEAKIKCATGVKFVSEFTKVSLDSCEQKCRDAALCAGFIYTSIDSCKLLGNIDDCKVVRGGSQSLYKLVNKGRSWESVFTIESKQSLAELSDGRTGQAKVIVQGVLKIDTPADYIIGVQTSGNDFATIWVDGARVAFADDAETLCGTSGLSLAVLKLHGLVDIVVEYVHVDEEDPNLRVIVYEAPDEALKQLEMCDIADDELVPLPPGTIFNFDLESCEEGYSGERCTFPICDEGCANGGMCIYPRECSCASGFAGEFCTQCAAGFLQISSTCMQISLIVAYASAFVLLIAGALLTPKIRQSVELRKFVRLLEDEMNDGFRSDGGMGKTQTWTMEGLQKSKDGVSQSAKSSPMWKLIMSKQKKVDLRLMKAHFIPKSSITLGEAFAAGASGMVCKAKYDSNPVCVKQLFSSLIDPADMQEFIHEASVLAELTHPQIVRFYGVAVDGERLYIVTELCKYSLESFIRSHKNGGGGLSTAHKLAILLQISRGMQYVHAQGIVHRDLKIGNVLVEDAPSRGGEFAKIKICDFGVSTCTGEKKYSDLVGTPGHIAPEIIVGEVNPAYVKKVDVFSFGMIMWHVFAGEADADRSMGTFESSEELNKAIAKRFRPEIRHSWPAQTKTLIQECWQKNPRFRPAFSAISERLACQLAESGTQYSEYSTNESLGVANGSEGGVLQRSLIGKIKARFSSLVGKLPRPPSTSPPPLPPRSPSQEITRHNGMSIELINPASQNMTMYNNPMEKMV